MLTSLTVLLVLTIRLSICQDRVDRFVGDTCKAKTYDGTCSKLEDCINAITQVQIYGNHNFTVCNYDNTDQVICCPGVVETTPTTKKSVQTELREPVTGLKTNQNCDRYSNTIKQELRQQVIGGKNASAGEFPHMAAIANLDAVSGELVWYCGGSLISENFVLTAAHCIINRQSRKPSLIRLGKLNLLTNEDNLEAQDFDVDSTIVHEQYTRRTKINDIALIKLKRSIVSTVYVHPACLYTKNDDPIGLIVTGWGSTSARQFNSSLTALQKATVEPVNTSNCNETLNRAIQTSVYPLQICAQSVNSIQDACQGDSGGPLQVMDRVRGNIRSIVGITSTGIGCGGSTPGIYTKVYAYIGWIESKVWP